MPTPRKTAAAKKAAGPRTPFDESVAHKAALVHPPVAEPQEESTDGTSTDSTEA